MQTEADPGLIVYFNERFVPLAEARVSVLTHALHYGTGVFEGVRAYWREAHDDMLLFRPEEHYRRWRCNCAILRIHLPVSPATLCELTAELLRRNDFRSDVYIRPIAWRSAARIGVQPDDQFAYSLIAIPYGGYFEKRGLHAGVVSWRRVEDDAIPARGKICGAYVNSVLAGDEARRAGFDEAIFLTEEGHVAEGAASNIFIVRDRKLITPPPTDNILEGITRDSVMELARRELRLEVVQRSIHRSELYACEEAFFTGTAVEIAPIVQVDRRPVGEGGVGPVTHQLGKLYSDVTHARLRSYVHWTQQVCVAQTAAL